MKALAVTTLLGCIGWLVIISLWLYERFARQWQLMAVADSERHLHQGRIPTGAGLAFLWPILLTLLVFSWPGFQRCVAFSLEIPTAAIWRAMALGLLIMLAIGHIDDRRHAPVTWRLLAQALAVFILMTVLWPLWQGAHLSWGWLVIFFIGALWWLNLFNFMDGINGMAVLHASVALFFYALIFFREHDPALAFVAASTLLASMLFLFWNFPQALLFMGDTGSLGLAWLIAAMALVGVASGIFGATFVIFLHAAFILDASITLFSRWRAGKPLTQAHREHLYQRLVATGRSHARVSLLYALVTAVGGLLAMLSLSWPANARWGLLLSWLACLGLVGIFLNQTTKNKPAA